MHRAAGSIAGDKNVDHRVEIDFRVTEKIHDGIEFHLSCSRGRKDEQFSSEYS